MTKFRADTKLREVMGAHYLAVKNAAYNNKKLAWVTSGAPVEFLYAMDIQPVYPENYAAMCGAAKMSQELIEVAESLGYPQDICSYARTDIGQAKVNGGPILGLPKPDLLVGATNICKTVVKWYEVVQRNYNCPFFLIDMPFLHDGINKDAIDHTVRQFIAFEKFLEEFTGKKFDREKFIEVLGYSLEASRLWKAILDSVKHKPSPINSFDTFIHLAPIVTLRGTKECVDYYTELYNEIQENIAQNKGTIPNERIRLLWDNLPIWYRIKYLSELFQKYDAALVAATYTASWAVLVEEPSPDKIYEELAKAYLSPYINRGIKDRIEIISNLIEEYDLDGFIMHSDRSCKPYSLGQYVVKQEVTRRTGKPGLIIESDQNDPRVFSEAQIETRVQAFIEAINGGRARA